MFWNDFIQMHVPSLEREKDYFIHTRNLYETIIRTDKRKTYYSVFHNISQICEYKEVALKCYWINTLKPFMVISQASPIYNCPNEMFTLFIIICVIRKIFDKKYPHKNFDYPSEKMIQDIVYNFKYCDLSREATIFFVEMFARSYGVGMDSLDGEDLDQLDC